MRAGNKINTGTRRGKSGEGSFCSSVEVSAERMLFSQV